MEWEIYELDEDKDGLGYTFYSEGPRGRIKKGVRFQWIRGLGSGTFNLAFGDYNEGDEYLDDRSITDNQDRLKVLHTVVTGVIGFLKKRPRSIILIKPNTLSRARLYQMMLSSIWTNYKDEYEAFGKQGDDWIPFRKGLNYTGFIIYKKIM